MRNRYLAVLLAVMILLIWAAASIPFGLVMGRVLFNGRNDAQTRSVGAAHPVGAIGSVGAVRVPRLS